MAKKILIVGGFSKARALTISLLQKKYEITLINNSYEDCQKLATIEGITVINGDGTKPYVLNDACAYEADIVIALTPQDDDNLVICQLCKKRFDVNKTICLLTDGNKKEFFYKMGIDVVVSAISIITGIIEQETILNNILQITHLDSGKVKVSELLVGTDAYSAYKKIAEIGLPRQLIISCILREDNIIIPNGETVILPDDRLVVVTSEEEKDFSKLTGRN